MPAFPLHGISYICNKLLRAGGDVLIWIKWVGICMAATRISHASQRERHRDELGGVVAGRASKMITFDFACRL